MSREYFMAFKAHCFTMLGGLDLAKEFFRLHPRLKDMLIRHSSFHEHKGGTPIEGAEIWFRSVAQRVIAADREEARKTFDAHNDPRN